LAVDATERQAREIAASPLPSELEIAAFFQTLGEMLAGDFRYHEALDKLRDCVTNRRLVALAEYLKQGDGQQVMPSEMLLSFPHIQLAFASGVLAECETRGELDIGFIETAAVILERAGRARGFRHFG
jgi:type II secretory pathway component PulF